MAYTTINKSTDHFDIRTYSASGAGSVSDVSFQPDFIWFKNRASVGDHGLFDAIRGVTKYLQSNNSSTGLTGNGSNDFTAFTSNGFNYGSSSQLDTSTGTPCTWLWKANGTGSANTAGSINSTVSVNTTSGFSIVKYTANGTQGATVGHGLGVTPKMMMFKNLDSTLGDGEVDWGVYHSSLTATNFLKLNTTQAQINSDGTFNDTEPSNTLFTLGGGSQGDRFATNRTGDDYIAYCFADVQGYSKFGSYTGNGSADGTFVYTGFSPSFVLYKDSTSVSDWVMKDNRRPGFNVTDDVLYPNLSDAEGSGADIDFLSNGFKARTTAANTNKSNAGFIYMAFAEQPLVGDNPATAR